jgi:hypothetical protein
VLSHAFGVLQGVSYAVRQGRQQSGCRNTLEIALLLYLEGPPTGTVSHRSVEQQVVEICGAMNFEKTHCASRYVQPGERGPETDSQNDSHGEQIDLPTPRATHYSTLTQVGAWYRK